MPEVDTGAVAAVNGADLAPLTGFRNVVNGRFTPGNHYGHGRPKGYAKAAALLNRSAPSLTRDLIRRSAKSDKLLAKAIDKILPDATVADQAGGVVPIFVIVGPRSVEAGGMSGRLSDAGQETGEAVVPRLLDAEPSAGTEHG